MTDLYQVSVKVPIDDDSALRRECPYCNKEFKFVLKKGELEDIIQKGLNSFMLDSGLVEQNDELSDGAKEEQYCPYCGQKAPLNQWWTKEQQEYFKIYVKNIAARIINENFIKQMKSQFSGNGLIKFEGKEIEEDEPWISPETNDMKMFELPCCNLKIKVVENYLGTIYCPYCGFPHNEL